MLRRNASMKVLAFNSSPRMEKGNTALIVAPFLEGMQESGAEVELLYIRKLKVNPCLGCFNCWLKTPGECAQKDDVRTLLPKMGESDILVLATPLYVDGMSGSMKNLLDRSIPGAQPFIEVRDGHCRHPGRGEHGLRKVVLVSNCGFWEKDNFDPLVVHVQAFCRNAGMEFAGALLRPHGEALRPMMDAGVSLDAVFDAARAAGRQLVRDGAMSAETLATVSRELLPREPYLQFANDYFQQVLDARTK
jgi:multimeric flavodoxin WrbA